MPLSSISFKQAKETIEKFTWEKGYPIASYVTRGNNNTATELMLVQYPSRNFPNLSEPEYRRAGQLLAARFNAQLSEVNKMGKKGITACVGLEEGFTNQDEQETIEHSPAEALLFLLTYGKDILWTTVRTTQVTTRRIIDDNNEEKLFKYTEPVIKISGVPRDVTQLSADIENPALQIVKFLGHRFKQKRVYVEDYQTEKTTTYAPADELGSSIKITS